MYDIYSVKMNFEQCLPDKREVKTIIPYTVLHFVLSGEGYINGKKITKNTAFIAFENTKVHFYPSRTDPWAYIAFRISGNDVEKAFRDHGFNLGLTIIPFSNTEELRLILSLNNKLLHMGNPDMDKIIANSVFLLFNNQKKTPSTKTKPNRHVEQIMQYIDKNYYKKVTIEDISSIFYLNKNYIRTIFVEQIGISPKQYLQKKRMERAAFLLASTNEPVNYIGYSVGYEDSLLFSKMFKKHYGISPSSYRSENKQ